MPGHKTNLKKFKNIEITQIMFSNYKSITKNWEIHKNVEIKQHTPK